LTGPRRSWILDLPRFGFGERIVRVRSRDAHKYVESVRGEPSEAPSISWGKEQSSRYGEDLVGGWLLRHGGLTEGLQKEVQVSIPEGGNQPRRRVDWLVGRRIIVEVKTYAQSLLKGRTWTTLANSTITPAGEMKMLTIGPYY
jgi:hypothetical protein